MPPWPSTPVTSYRPRTTSPTLHSVSTAAGAGTASAIVGRGTGAASGCVAAGTAAEEPGREADAGSGTRNDAWQRPQRTVRPATVAGALAFAPQVGQVTRTGAPGGETAIRRPAAAHCGTRPRSRSAATDRPPPRGPRPGPGAPGARGRAAA